MKEKAEKKKLESQVTQQEQPKVVASKDTAKTASMNEKEPTKTNQSKDETGKDEFLSLSTLHNLLKISSAQCPRGIALHLLSFFFCFFIALVASGF